MHVLFCTVITCPNISLEIKCYYHTAKFPQISIKYLNVGISCPKI